MANVAPPDVIVLDDEEEHFSPTDIFALRQKVISLEAQLEGARKRADNAYAQMLELTHEIEELKKELAEPRMEAQDLRRRDRDLNREIASLKDQLADAERRADESGHRASDLAYENDALRKKAESADRADDLARENEALKSELAETRRTFSRIEELVQQHSQSQGGSQLQMQPLQQAQKRQSYETPSRDFPPPEKMVKISDDREERWRQPQQQQSQHYSPPPMQQQQPAAAATLPPSPTPVVTVSAPPPPPIQPPAAAITDGPNLFELCEADAAESIAVDKAAEQLRQALEHHGREHIKSRQAEKLRCAPCKFSYTGIAVVDHFLIPRHQDKVRGKGVSPAALEHWLQLLQPNDGQ